MSLPAPGVCGTVLRISPRGSSIHPKQGRPSSSRNTTTDILLIGKQARAPNMNDDTTRKNDASPPDAPQPVVHGAMPPTQPVDVHNGPHQGIVRDAYSDAPGDARNKVAQAGHAAAHHAEPAQKVKHESSKSRRVDEANLAKLVAEENASKSKFPRYPGLERWDLREKMGDGAFSNVYRARDLQGEYGEVAIKVVRKYEMNNMQVSASGLVLFCDA